jgi:hypothetical protein
MLGDTRGHEGEGDHRVALNQAGQYAKHRLEARDFSVKYRYQATWADFLDLVRDAWKEPPVLAGLFIAGHGACRPGEQPYLVLGDYRDVSSEHYPRMPYRRDFHFYLASIQHCDSSCRECSASYRMHMGILPHQLETCGGLWSFRPPCEHSCTWGDVRRNLLDFPKHFSRVPYP